MPVAWDLLLGGTPMDDDFYGAIQTLEVEENADLPDALSVKLTVARTDAGDYDLPGDARIGPLANLAVLARAEGGGTQCIFDGYVLSHRLHADTGTAATTLTVWAQDASWLMNVDEKVREWPDVTDDDVASQIFADYGIEPDGGNAGDDSAVHGEETHSLMQRATDIQFLRMLARRSGKLCRVTCRDAPGVRRGIFAKPDLGGEPVATIDLNDPDAPTVDALDFSWDVSAPTEVQARQALFDDDTPEGVSADSTDSGLSALDDRDLAAFAGSSSTALLTATVDDGGELALRTQAAVRDASWFVRCEGEAVVDRVGRVLRVGDLVAIAGAGALHSGRYLVWSVRHTIAGDAHRMRFVLLRNALGSAS